MLARQTALGVCCQNRSQIHRAGALGAVEAPNCLDGVGVHVERFGTVAPAGGHRQRSFDCSGYVSWVINNCGVGWNFGRLTADGLLGVCTPVSSADAKPGDLIFFQGTYNTSGASHVGIYVGNGMMIHCGDPISYANINTSYWQQHFYTFGRLP